MSRISRLSRCVSGAALLGVTATLIAVPLLANVRPANASLLAPHIPADPAPVQPATAPNFEIPNGHFFSQTGGTEDGSAGFILSNAAGVPFYNTFNALGGVDELGFPASQRFTWLDRTVQVMQRNVMVWDGTDVTLSNTFDLLHDYGYDEWLEETKKVPPPFSTAADTGRTWEEVKELHLALLQTDDAIRERYYANPRHIEHYGLPMSYRDYEEVFVIRAQRVVFQKWKVDTSFAQAGQVTIANGGDVAKEAGLFPAEALKSVPSPFEQGQANLTPWSGWWWPSHKNGGEPQIWQPNGPYDKYDRYVQSLGMPNPDVVGWEKANMRFEDEDEEWAGHCNGWAAAAILEPEPTAPVTVNGITFSVGDQKGLLSGYHFGDEAAWVVGGKPNGTTPQELRQVLELWLGEKNKPFLANLYSKDDQVWSAPAYRYETLYGPDATKPNVNHFRTKVWYADYHVGPNYVGTQIFGGEPKVYEYWLEGPVNNPTDGGWEGISATASDFAKPFHLWYPDPTTRNGRRWTPALRYDIIKEIVPGAGTAPAEFRAVAGMMGFRLGGSGTTPLLPNSFWMPDES